MNIILMDEPPRHQSLMIWKFIEMNVINHELLPYPSKVTDVEGKHINSLVVVSNYGHVVIIITE